MKFLLTLLLLTLHFSLSGQALGQTFPEYFGTAADGNLMIYDGGADARWELIAGSTFVTNLCTDLLQCESPTDDGVPVGNSTSFDIKVLTDCDDSGGNHLNYDTGTNAFSCGTSTSGSSFGSSIDDTELTAEDFGDFTCTALENGCTVDDLSIEYNTDVTGAADGVATIVGGVGVIQTAFASLEGELDDLDFGSFAEGDILIVNSSADIRDLSITSATESYVAVGNLSDVSVWTDWTPTLGVSGGTFGSTSITLARYMRLEDAILLYLEITGTCGTTPDYLTFTLPVGAISGDTSSFACFMDDAGTGRSCATLNAGSSTVRVYGNQDAGTAGWADGVCGYNVNGLYEAA